MIVATLTTTDPTDRATDRAAAAAVAGTVEAHPVLAGVHHLLQTADPRDLRRVPAGATWYVVGTAHGAA